MEFVTVVITFVCEISQRKEMKYVIKEIEIFENCYLQLTYKKLLLVNEIFSLVFRFTAKKMKTTKNV